jgi:AbrB family looped-hinge helix DNA binding protein
MLTKVSSKGQTVIPLAIRQMARIQAGDELDVGFAGGLVVLRKRQPLTAEKVRELLREGRRLPELTDEAWEKVEAARERVRRRQRP